MRVFWVCGKLKTLDNHNSETMANLKKNFVPNFPLMTTTDSQNFREIQEINLKFCIFLVTFDMEYPRLNNSLIGEPNLHVMSFLVVF